MDKLVPLENEKWVWAKTFNEDYSHYLVSDMGRCWNCKTKQFVGHCKDGHCKDGYWYVGLSKNGKQEHMMIGRLMLISFGVPIPKHLQGLPTNKLDCMHIDGNSKNNSLENFQWGSRKENLNEENAIRRMSEAHKDKHLSEEHKKRISDGKKGKEHKKGKDSPCSKQILQYTLSGEFIRQWDCAMDAQKKLGIHQGNISNCARGKRKSAGGYIWKYKEEAV